MFKERWNRAVEEDKEWADPFPRSQRIQNSQRSENQRHKKIRRHKD